MMTLDSLATFLGWCAVINIGVLLLSTLLVCVLKDWVVGIHSKMFKLNPADLPMAYFEYLGNYKIAIYILNIVPYIALKIMA